MLSTLIASKLWAGANFSVITPVIEYLVKEAPALYPLLDLTRVHPPEHIRGVPRYIYYFAQQISFGISAMAGLGSRTGHVRSEANLLRWVSGQSGFCAGFPIQSSHLHIIVWHRFTGTLVLANASCFGCRSPLVTPNIAGRVRSTGLSGRLSVGARERRLVSCLLVDKTERTETIGRHAEHEAGLIGRS